MHIGSWGKNPGGKIQVEKSRRKNPGGKTWTEMTWKGNIVRTVAQNIFGEKYFVRYTLVFSAEVATQWGNNWGKKTTGK